MAYLTSVFRRGTSSLITLPRHWVRWVAREGYSVDEVDLTLEDDGRLVVRPIRHPDPVAHRAEETVGV